MSNHSLPMFISRNPPTPERRGEWRQHARRDDAATRARASFFYASPVRLVRRFARARSQLLVRRLSGESDLFVLKEELADE